jgi:TonB family protein
MKPEKMKVAVLSGGTSGEREVSQRSGAAVAKALRSVGVRLVEVDVKSTKVEIPQGTDICFLCLHGGYGEDGTIQAELDSQGIAYTGSGSEASARAFDKLRAKEVMGAAGLPLAEGLEWNEENSWIPPYVLKPVADGSSLGVHLVRTEEEAKKAEERHQEEVKRLRGLADATGTPADTGKVVKAAAPSATYLGKLRAKVKPNIVFSDTQLLSVVGNPAAEVEVTCSPSGQIIGAKLSVSSGNAAWDQAVLNAVEKTGSLPRDESGNVPNKIAFLFRPRD